MPPVLRAAARLIVLGAVAALAFVAGARFDPSQWERLEAPHLSSCAVAAAVAVPRVTVTPAPTRPAGT